MSSGISTESPSSPPFDAEYYASLTEGLGLRVLEMEGKGKGVVATRDYAVGEEVLRESALAAVQNADEQAYTHLGADGRVRVCMHTLRSLETPQDMFGRCCKGGQVHLPRVEQFRFPHAAQAEGLLDDEPEGGCKCPGCEARFCSESARAKAWDQYHCVLCTGDMNADQRAALAEWTEESWLQGGIDYSDTFALALQYFATAAAAARVKGIDVEEAWKPLAMLISCPWQCFRFGYLLQGGEEEEPGPSKDELVAKAAALLRVILGEQAALATERRVSMTLGCVLLNGQERTPTSPWEDYIEWLQDSASPPRRQLAKIREKTGRHIAKLSSSTRGQATYRVGACFNHSCVPNIEVGYNTLQDETLLVTACLPIKAGDELCISYIDEHATLATRQAHLVEHYLFECSCPKCRADSAQQA